MHFPWLNTLEGNNQPLFFILGPCVLESETSALHAAEFLTKLSQKLQFNFVFKAAFDKANRTALGAFRGHSIDEGLRILERIRKEFSIPVLTDVHETHQVNTVASVVDVLQIPAFLCRQTDLLVAAGKTGKPINVKKGQFIAPEGMKSVAEKVASSGNKNIWLCERGYTFGYQNLIVDYRNFPIMKTLGYPVIFDATHSVQRPGGLGNATGGDRCFVPPLAASAIVQGIAGIFMEVHENPEKALSDGPNSIRHQDLEKIISYLQELDTWAKQRKIPDIT